MNLENQNSQLLQKRTAANEQIISLENDRTLQEQYTSSLAKSEQERRELRLAKERTILEPQLASKGNGQAKLIGPKLSITKVDSKIRTLPKSNTTESEKKLKEAQNEIPKLTALLKAKEPKNTEENTKGKEMEELLKVLEEKLTDKIKENESILKKYETLKQKFESTKAERTNINETTESIIVNFDTNDIFQLQNENAKLKNAVRDLEDEIKTRKENEEAIIETHKNELERLHIEIKDLKIDNSALNVSLLKTNSELEKLHIEIKDLRIGNSAQNDSLSKTKSEREKRHSLKSDKSALNVSLSKTKSDLVNETPTSTEKELQIKSAKLVEVSKAIIEIDAMLTKSKSEFNDLKTKTELREKEISEREKEFTEKENAFKQTEKELEEQTAKLNGLSKKFEKSEALFIETTTENTTLRVKLAEVTNQCAQLEQSNKNLADCLNESTGIQSSKTLEQIQINKRLSEENESLKNLTKAFNQQANKLKGKNQRLELKISTLRSQTVTQSEIAKKDQRYKSNLNTILRLTAMNMNRRNNEINKYKEEANRLKIENKDFAHRFAKKTQKSDEIKLKLNAAERKVNELRKALEDSRSQNEISQDDNSQLKKALTIDKTKNRMSIKDMILEQKQSNPDLVNHSRSLYDNKITALTNKKKQLEEAYLSVNPLIIQTKNQLELLDENRLKTENDLEIDQLMNALLCDKEQKKKKIVIECINSVSEPRHELIERPESLEKECEAQVNQLEQMEEILKAKKLAYHLLKRLQYEIETSNQLKLQIAEMSERIKAEESHRTKTENALQTTLAEKSEIDSELLEMKQKLIEKEKEIHKILIQAKENENLAIETNVALNKDEVRLDTEIENVVLTGKAKPTMKTKRLRKETDTDEKETKKDKADSKRARPDITRTPRNEKEFIEIVPSTLVDEPMEGKMEGNNRSARLEPQMSANRINMLKTIEKMRFRKSMHTPTMVPSVGVKEEVIKGEEAKPSTVKKHFFDYSYKELMKQELSVEEIESKDDNVIIIEDKDESKEENEKPKQGIVSTKKRRRRRRY